VGIWLVGLGVWNLLLKSEQARIAIVAAATCMTAGGAVLDYLRWEAAAINSQSGSFTPLSLLPGLCDTVLHFNLVLWLQAASPMLLAMVWFTVGRIAKTQSTSLHNAL
jgi:hypothetical protein